MKEFFNQKIADNTITAWLIVIAVIVGAFFIRKLISQIIANFIIRFFPNKGNRTYKADFKEFISKPLGDLIFLAIAFTSLDRLKLPSFFQGRIFDTNYEKIIHSIGQIVMVYATIRLLRGISKFVFSIWRYKAEDVKNKSAVQLLSVVGGLINAVLIVIGIMIISKSVFGWDVSGFITSLGIFSAALALAGKESLENLIASFIIFLDKPFYIGDYVTVNGNSGTIESIGLRSSRLRTLEKTLLVVPNKQMVDSVVTNVSSRTQWRYTENLEVSLSVAADQLNRLQAGIREILQQNEVDSQFVYLKQTGGSCHIIYLEYYVSVGKRPGSADIYDLNGKINAAIISLFQSENIAFAQESSTVVSIQQPMVSTSKDDSEVHE